ncbi:phage major capsid protein [Hyphomicrobiales bacterium]|nr:phage major capsid protein [Hyphomicrobiales bacterium]
MTHENVSDARDDLNHRTLLIELDERAGENRTIEASLSSELPVPRGEYNEILVHEPSAINMERADIGLPLLFGHDQQDPIGTVENVRISEDKKLRGTLRLGQSTRATEVWNDIKSKVLRFLSIGYSIDEVKEVGRNQLVTSWQPYEVSVVGVPADHSIGIQRSYPKPKESIMENKIETKIKEASNERASKEILALGKHHRQIEFATDCAMKDMPLDEFRSKLLDRVKTEPIASAYTSFEQDQAMSKREYSIGKVISAQLNSDWSNAGFEREMSQEIATRQNRTTTGAFVPPSAFGQRTLLDTTNTSNLVGTEYMPQSFIDVLRPFNVSIDAGATTMAGLNQNVAIPRKTLASAGEWVAEGSPATESTPTFDQLTLSPNGISSRVSYTRQALTQMLPPLENLMRNDLMMGVSEAIDKAVINGTGGVQPTGILNTTGLSLVSSGANGGAITYDNISTMIANVDTANGLLTGRGTFVTNSQVANKLRTTLRNPAGTDATYISNNRDELLGYRYLQSQNVPNTLTKGTGANLSALIFGDWSNVIIGEFGAPELIVDPYTFSTRGDVIVTIFGFVDVGIRHIQGFSAINDIVTT